MSHEIVLPKSQRRIQTDADLAMATAVAQGMFDELTQLIQIRSDFDEGIADVARRLEGIDEEGAEKLRELLTSSKEERVDLNIRITELRRQLLNWPTVASQVTHKQIETRHKSGELVTVASAYIFINQLSQLLKRYVDPRYKSQAQRESQRLLSEFINENPASILSAGSDKREQEEEARVIDQS